MSNKHKSLNEDDGVFVAKSYKNSLIFKVEAQGICIFSEQHDKWIHYELQRFGQHTISEMNREIHRLTAKLFERSILTK